MVVNYAQELLRPGDVLVAYKYIYLILDTFPGGMFFFSTPMNLVYSSVHTFRYDWTSVGWKIL